MIIYLFFIIKFILIIKWYSVLNLLIRKHPYIRLLNSHFYYFRVNETGFLYILQMIEALYSWSKME
jgi:hypothetical protein